MEKDLIVQLTNNLYRLTLLFPKKEPLRYKLREVASSILIKPAIEDVETLNNLFEVARAQNWVSPAEILAVQDEYAKLNEWLKKEANSLPFSDATSLPHIVQQESQTVSLQAIECRSVNEKEMEKIEQEDKAMAVKSMPSAGISPRQEKILMFLKENGKAQVWEIKKVMPEVTKRTLRRDFEGMVNQGAIERIGERNNTFYQIKSV